MFESVQYPKQYVGMCSTGVSKNPLNVQPEDPDGQFYVRIDVSFCNASILSFVDAFIVEQCALP